MKIELTFEDFRLDAPQQSSIKGGQANDEAVTFSNCTSGDEGCCDSYTKDDIVITTDDWNPAI